ncbi:MAG: 3-deoxy-D-manno-octulosonic acid transferase [Lentisphaerae bacterium]|nr:3-deoxy-D-manno-octulosonic acid transferase [Lentisphaerota bacterium]
MIWLFYNLVFPIAFLLLLPRFIMRMWKRGGYRQGFLQRFGWYAPELRDRLRAKRRVWIHAVSVGEVQVALRFISVLRERRNALAFILTTTTSTGHAIAAQCSAFRRSGLAEAENAEDVLLYFPADFPWIMARVLNLLRPTALVLVESEFWPNLLRLARRRGVPIMLLNGRVSDHSFRGYRKVKLLVKRALETFDLFCMQGETDARRLQELGAPPEKIRVSGSAKYDVAESANGEANAVGQALRQAGFEAGARWLIGGSTWPGEEAILLNIYKKLRAMDSKARLALIPRHAERRQAVMAEIQKSGLTGAAWSALKAGRAGAAADVLLVDTTGELKFFYALAAVIFVGKSLTAHGGQNVIEAAVLAKPIVIGPYTENFAAIVADFRAADALIQVPDAAALERAVMELWTNNQETEAYGRRAEQLVRAKAGALRASAECLLKLLDSRAQPS